MTADDFVIDRGYGPVDCGHVCRNFTVNILLECVHDLRPSHVPPFLGGRYGLAVIQPQCVGKEWIRIRESLVIVCVIRVPFSLPLGPGRSQLDAKLIHHHVLMILRGRKGYQRRQR